MPLYTWACPTCKLETEGYRKIDERHDGPECCGSIMPLVIKAAMINPDWQPYHTVAADKKTGKTQEIGSRRQHREFLARNGYEEIGSENFDPTPRKHEDDKDDDF